MSKQSPSLRDRIADLLAEELYGTYDCTRVWEAWSYKTMSANDFQPVDDRVLDIVEGVIKVILESDEGKRAILIEKALEQMPPLGPMYVESLKAHRDWYRDEILPIRHLPTLKALGDTDANDTTPATH